MARACSVCSCANRDDAKFCKGCGSKFALPTATVSAAPETGAETLQPSAPPAQEARRPPPPNARASPAVAARTTPTATTQTVAAPAISRRGAWLGGGMAAIALVAVAAWLVESRRAPPPVATQEVATPSAPRPDSAAVADTGARSNNKSAALATPTPRPSPMTPSAVTTPPMAGITNASVSMQTPESAGDPARLAREKLEREARVRMVREQQRTAEQTRLKREADATRQRTDEARQRQATRSPAVEPPVQAVAATASVQSVSQACSGRSNFISEQFCRVRECMKSTNAADQVCVAMQRLQQTTARPAEH